MWPVYNFDRTLPRGSYFVKKSHSISCPGNQKEIQNTCSFAPAVHFSGGPLCGSGSWFKRYVGQVAGLRSLRDPLGMLAEKNSRSNGELAWFEALGYKFIMVYPVPSQTEMFLQKGFAHIPLDICFYNKWVHVCTYHSINTHTHIYIYI